MTRLPPNTSRRPIATPLAMTTAPPDPVPPPPSPPPSSSTAAVAEATPSPLPRRPRRKSNDESSSPSSPTAPSSKAPLPHPSFPQPKLRLEVRDLAHAGAVVFFTNTPNATTVLTDAVVTVLQTIYTPFEGAMETPGTRSITLILRPMDGVAYTTGSELDGEHKEIHFNLNYLAGIDDKPPGRRRQEILGVLLHEMVHVWQWNGQGRAPGGLIEGIADLVRLRAGLSPPHWKREAGGDWDAGYQHTAYFLDWLEKEYGSDKLIEINEALRVKGYDEAPFWKSLFGKEVGALWDEYTKYLKGEETRD